ncbi:hypothetical protein ELE40_23700 (plasmid) [Escherichia coli]|uniref:Phage EaE protein n=2 Tax=Escherichia coli TaxID=562 RepID=A0A7T8R0P3_ECOLX|nr:hypothetical protein [Escherichia coli]AZU74187.1 hypothetical protein EM855_23700 [Escherichia coli]AZU78674.1 hypothetical protein ELE40_23700 [Escherichia coli]QQP62030.1 Phage EaE protein [Escherichia coli]HAZ7492636.1 hypothetical protein [Escherichia coli]
MREKIKNPVVVLYKRETSDSYAVSITDGSQNMHDGLLMASVSPDDSDYPFATFAMVGYYMAAEIEKLRAQRDALAAENAAFKDINAWCKTDAFKNMYREFKTAEAVGCCNIDCMHDAMVVAIMHAPEAPATDAFLAEIERKVIRKFINSIEHILRDKLSPYDTEEMLETMRIFLEEQGGEQK